MSPDGSAVFVTGRSKGNPDFDYATVAYRAGSGRQIWVRRFDGSSSRADDAYAIAASPDGARVVVTGSSVDDATGRDYVTVAYNAGTGHRQWVSRFTGPRRAADRPTAIAISGDNSNVFVTGQRAGGGTHLNYGTVAYDVHTGSKLWADTYDGPDSLDDAARGLVVAGSFAVVTGFSFTAGSAVDYSTIAYDGGTGSRHWIYPYDGGVGGDFAHAIATSADGAFVFVTGTSAGAGTGDDYATVSYPT